MKLVVAAAILVAARPSHACDLLNIMSEEKEIHPSTVDEHAILPLVIASGGITSDGLGAGGNIGLGWGRRIIGGCQEGVMLTRVLVGVTRADHTTASATYGWYGSDTISGGFDVGVEADHTGGGPIARLTFGFYGVALRLTGGAIAGTDTRLVGSAELVIDITDIVTRTGTND